MRSIKYLAIALLCVLSDVLINSQSASAQAVKVVKIAARRVAKEATKTATKHGAEKVASGYVVHKIPIKVSKIEKPNFVNPDMDDLRKSRISGTTIFYAEKKGASMFPNDKHHKLPSLDRDFIYEKRKSTPLNRAMMTAVNKDVAKNSGKLTGKAAVNQVKNFDPYVGKDYSKGINGKTVMSLGDSHYCKDQSEVVSSFTKDRMEEYRAYLEGRLPLKDNGWMQTYNNWLNTYAGRKLSKAEKLELLDKMCFYNYVQVPMSGMRIRPKAADWKCSAEAFMNELKRQKPDVVVAWGNDVYKHLPKDIGHRGRDIVLSNGKVIETWIYEIEGKSITVVRTNHPSSYGYDAELWNEVIKAVV